MQFINVENTNSLIPQKIEGVRTIPEYTYRIYYEDKIIGNLSSLDGIDPLLDQVYRNKYIEEFPDSKLSLNDDIYISKELSFLAYENQDEAILNYINSNELFAVQVDKISFSNGAVLYVKNIDDFTQARNQYVLNFISEEGLSNIQNKITTPDLTTYTYKETNITIQESIEITQGYASIEDIKTSVSDIIYYLSYGDETEPEYYTVQQYDTVEGIARQYGVEAQHIVMVNPDILKSTDQILTVGMELNVTYYDSPITIIVERERLYQEIVYPESTQYIYDSSLAEGRRVPVQAEKEGSADILMKETYINGVLMQDMSSRISSTITVSPQREIIKLGTRVIPGVGTGTFRWPVDNPTITCRWWCYDNHRAIDVQNRYNRYGNVYAADRGTVVTNSYDRVSGYYVRINHGNGFLTWYGHLRYKSPINVGAKVDKGSVIGTIGMTGTATGPHVHFAIERNGVRVNPCNYLRC